MEAKSIQQEILLITGTSLSAGPWIKNDDAANDGTLSEKEKLELACWNGLLGIMLPELCPEPGSTKKLYLWKIVEGSSFLELDLGEYPVTKDSHFSIDPYLFLGTQCGN
jgi:hypothetical protein